MGVVLAGLVLPNVQNHSLASLGGALRRAGIAHDVVPFRGWRDIEPAVARARAAETSGDTVFGVSVQNTEAALASITLARVLRRRGLPRAHRLRRPFREPERGRHPERGFRDRRRRPPRRRGGAGGAGAAARARRSSSRRCRERSFAATTAPFGSARPPGRSARFRAPLHGDELPLHLGFRAADLVGSSGCEAHCSYCCVAATTRLAATEARRGRDAIGGRRVDLGRGAMDERPAGQPRSPPSITRGRHGFSR